METQPTDLIAKSQTGIPGFDLISKGGLPRGRTTIITGSSGSAKTIFATQFLVSGVKTFNENGVFVTFEEIPKDIVRNVKSLGWRLDHFVEENRLAFVDCSPDPMGAPKVSGDFDFNALLARIEAAVKKVSAKRIVIDSMGALFSQFSDSGKVRQEIFRIVCGLRSLEVTAIVTLERTDEYGDVSRFGVEEFVADNVVILRNSLEEEKRRRTVEILKVRGAEHQKGEFPFSVSKNGLEVIPLSAMELTQKSSMVRLSTGNKDIDKMCGGGFFRDSIVLVSGATGTGKTLMVTRFVDDGSRRGEKTLVFAFEESREQLLRNAKGWGMDFTQWENKGLLKVICAYPEIYGLEDHLIHMKREIEKFGPSRIAVDSLSAMERVSSVKSFREFVIALTSYIKEKQAAGLFTATTASLMGGTSVTETHISTITDSIVLLRYVELLGEMRRGITVLKMRGSLHDKKIREYTIDAEGMHVGNSFDNVSGILAGAPMQVLNTGDPSKVGHMFSDT
jgi:circadian clock protein KaiC